MKRKRRAAAPLRRGPAILLGDGCLLLLVLAGTVFSFLTAFSVQIHALPLLLGCAAAALAFLGLWSLPRRWWALPLALLAAAWVLAVRRLWQPLALGAEALRVDVVNTVSASLELGFTLEPALSLPEALWTNCATLLVLLALVPLGALLGLGVVRLRSFWLVFVSSFPFVLLPLCISVTPGWLPLMALVLGWVVPALTSLLARTSPLGAVRLNLAALPAAALLLAALSLAMPMDTYQRPAWADRALQHLTNQAVRLGDGLLEGSGPFGIGSGGGRLADADGSVSLSDAGPLRFSGRTVLEVETDLPDGPVMVWGDPDAVTQVCYNLLDNAVKFAAPKGKLTLKITTKGGKAYIAIGNEGETIPPEQLTHIFDRFHKADSSRSTHKDGVGLGLYIVKTLLNTYKEDITVTSENGFTEFTFTLSEV